MDIVVSCFEKPQQMLQVELGKETANHKNLIALSLTPQSRRYGRPKSQVSAGTMAAAVLTAWF